MSNGGFGGIHRKLLNRLADASGSGAEPPGGLPAPADGPRFDER
jgi:hypothetical protein